jgi:hypothetical protein
VPDSEFPLLQTHLAGPALKWLRENYPLDEEAATETEEERELRERAEKLGLYYRPQEGVKEGKSVYGRSGLDVIKETYEKKAERKYGSKMEESSPEAGNQNQSTAVQTGGQRVGELSMFLFFYIYSYGSFQIPRDGGSDTDIWSKQPTNSNPTHSREQRTRMGGLLPGTCHHHQR